MINVTIGSVSKTYVLMETTAPAVDDGFGTITINAIGPKRWVLIEQAHCSWQTQRYGSGVHGHRVCDGTHREHAAIERLWERLIGRKGNA